MARIAQQGLIARHTRRRRKCPQNAAVEDAALVRPALHGQVMIHIAEPAAEFLAHKLHSVADAQHRHAQLIHALVAAGGILLLA